MSKIYWIASAAMWAYMGYDVASSVYETSPLSGIMTALAFTFGVVACLDLEFGESRP